MKKKGILISGIIVISFAAIIVFFATYQKSNTQNNPDISFKPERSQSIQGAMEYYQMIKGDLKTGFIDPILVSQAYAEADKVASYRAALGLNWVSRGPDNMGGRIRGFVIDNANPSILYASGVSGGVYKSTNGGKSWSRKAFAASAGGLIVSCMTQAKDGTLYFGTGEGYFNMMSGPNGDMTSGSRGGGVYTSADRGETWEFITSTDPTKGSMWYNVQSIKTDPNNPSIIYAASYGGLMKSTDAGASWNREIMPESASTQTYIDIQISPDGKTIYTASYSAGRCKVFRSKDGGAFERVASSINEITRSTRITIAISTKNPNYVYLCSASDGTSPYPGTHSFGGLYLTTDNGDNFTQVIAGHSEAEPFGRTGQFQGQYDNCVAVDPFDEKHVFVGGVDFYCYNDGFWYKAASLEEYLDEAGNYKNPMFIHADKHNIVFDAVSNPAKMYVCTDGGLYVSSDFTNKYPTYSSVNLYLHTTQFYALAVHPRGDIVGGTQDQSSIRIEYDGLTGNSGEEVYGGDGFYCEISRYNPDIYFYESQGGACVRSKSRGKNDEGFVYNPKENSFSINDDFAFNTPFRLWEDMEKQTFLDSIGNPYDSFVHISKFFISGGKGLWMTEQAIDFNADSIKWFNISKGITDQIVCMEYSKNGDAVFVGTNNWTQGRLYRISGLRGKRFWFDGSGNFNPDNFGIVTELLQSWPSRTVCGIGISPSDNNVLAVALGNYVNGFNHVYRTTNALDSVANVTFSSIHGNLPHMPVFDVAFNSQSSNNDTIIIGTELGVYSTTNGGTTWTEENTGMMDRAPVFMIRQYKKSPWSKSYTFFIGSHGMGIFEETTLDPAGIKESKRQIAEKLSIFPNPVNDHMNIRFNLNNNKNLIAEIYSLNGAMVKTLPINNAHSGMNQYVVNTSDMKSGIYIIRLRGEQIQLTNRFIIIK
ncbi:T9SS type A sorting domain-containing protein [Bacteroidota bacterium]